MAFVRGDEEITKQVFGYNEAVGTGHETVWPSGGFITLGESGAAQTMTVTSAGGATDNGVKIMLEGLDGATWNPATEEVTLSGSGTAVTSATMARVNRAWVSGSQEPTGDCTITSTTNGTTRLVVHPTKGSGNCTFTVPWGYTGYIDSINATCDSTASVDLVISIQEYKSGTGFLVKDKSRTFKFTGSYFRSFKTPVPIPQGSAVELQAKCSTESALSADFVLLLDKI